MIRNVLDKRFPFENNGSTGDFTPIWTPAISTILIRKQQKINMYYSLFLKVVLNTIGKKKTTKTIPKNSTKHHKTKQYLEHSTKH